MSTLLQYQIALTLIDNVGDVLAKNLVSYCGGVEKLFRAKKRELIHVPGIDEVRAKSILQFEKWKEVDAEINFIEKNNVKSFFYLDDDYPSRMKGLADAPVMLFAKGNIDLNASRIVGIVGTRHATDYGRQITEELVQGLSACDVTIVSGLAYGIDIAAHRAALKPNLQNIGVLGHGLNRIYPGSHRTTAMKMMENGGLLTEFKSCDAFEPQNFPKRNRIVAGLSDAVIVVESAINGGALITAEIANGFNRDVFCVPGKIGDKFSEGCNNFIKTGKASLIQNAEDVALMMKWKSGKEAVPAQKELFIELNQTENQIVDLLKKEREARIDFISSSTGLYGSQLASALLNLEFKGVVNSLPGKLYRLA